MFQVQWGELPGEVAREEDNVRRRLAEPQHVAVSLLYDPLLGSQSQDVPNPEGRPCVPNFPGKLH